MESGRLNGEVITKLRNEGMSYEALASGLGVSPVMVRQMERGYPPRRNREVILKRLATIARCSVSALISLKAS